MCNVTCEHINSYKSTHGVDSYEILHAFYVSCIAKDSRKRKTRDCLCMSESCSTRYQRIHACLSCIYFGCYNEGHIHQHAQENGHILAVDTNFGHVYCFICGDYQYDPEFEKIALKHKLWAVCKRGEGRKCKWEPKEIELLEKHIIINVDHIGLRGIINLGNTCYMNVILQSLVHAPLLRDYLLSYKHKCSIQQNNSSEFEDQVSVNKRSKPVCFVCEMSEIVQEFFSGKVEAFIPDRFLHLIWFQESSFKTPEQHDAHEFLLVLLNYLHLHCQGSNQNISANDEPCNCIIDTIFTGSLQYEYTCQDCKSVSLNPEPCKNLPLDTHSHKLSANNDTNEASSVPPLNLGYCLMKTIQSREIVKATCANCKKYTDFSTTMTLNKLPLIISFHLKFCNDKAEDKKFINFPEFLDMTPYIPPYKAQTNRDDNTLNSHNSFPSNEFYLFAVVKHDGDSDGGHYSCFVRRHKTNWFFCNDCKVNPVSIDEVLKTKAYLLFYHRKILEYESKNFEQENSS